MERPPVATTSAAAWNSPAEELTRKLRGIALDSNVVRVQDDIHTAALALGKEHVENGAGGVVTEELAEGLLVPWDAVAVDEFEEVRGLIESECGFGEVRVVGEEAIGRAMNVGEVAAATSGDEDFAAGLGVVFEQDNAAAALSGDGGAHEAGGAGAEDDGVIIVHSSQFVVLSMSCEPSAFSLAGIGN